MTEADFQAHVVQLATILRWHHLHVRRSIGKNRRWTTATNLTGWPDLLLWHTTQHRVIAAELKSDTGKPTPEQLDVLATLNAAGIETHIWYPKDLDTIARILSDRGGPPPRGLAGEGPRAGERAPEPLVKVRAPPQRTHHHLADRLPTPRAGDRPQPR